ncbi:MAG TPA: GTP-binding protein [Ramlibacter sp.]|nr:GTP-binding protein [Ramlibacter sp.]
MTSAARIPVFLLTGGLGSGKTTLLASWLRQPALERAALVINEIGEVGLDDRLLLPITQSGEGAALLANTCICCSGLPGLEEAMADLYRARLERRIPRFDMVVIETTGLAEPQGVREAFARDALLRERYVLAGVITTVSATAAAALDTREELRAQVEGADLLVVTKVDRVDVGALAALEQRLRALNPQAALARSAQADLAADEALRLLPPPKNHAGSQPLPATTHDDEKPGHAHHDDHHHRHAAEALFVPLPRPVPRAALAQAVQRCVAAGADTLLRLKGVVLADDGSPVAVQWALGDQEAVLAPFSGEAPVYGLTVIATGVEQAAELGRRLAALDRPA